MQRREAFVSVRHVKSEPLNHEPCRQGAVALPILRTEYTHEFVLMPCPFMVKHQLTTFFFFWFISSEDHQWRQNTERGHIVKICRSVGG